MRGVGLIESQDDQKNTSQSFNTLGSEEFEIQEITPTDFEVCIT